MRRTVFLLLLVLLAGCDQIGGLTEQDYIARAQDALDEGKPRTALIELKNALRENPDNSQARWLLGRIYLDTGNGPAAEKELRKAHELGIVAASTIPMLTKALLLQEKYQEVLDLGVNHADSDSAMAEALASRGIAYLGLDDQANAKQELEKALQAAPNSTYALTSNARFHADLKEYETAHQLLDKALAQDPDYAPAWSLKGNLQMAQNEMEAALAAFTKAIDNRVDNYEDIVKRGMVLIQLRRFDEAQQDVDLLEKRAKDKPDMEFLQGVLYYESGRLAEARESFDLVLRNAGSSSPALYYMGMTQLQLGNTEQAEQHLSRYVSTHTYYIPSRIALAFIKLNNGDYQEVEKLLRPVVAARDNIQAMNLLAKALIKQGKTDEAIELLEKIVTLEPDSPTARAKLGIGLLMQGDRQGGRESLATAIELDPEHQQSDIVLILTMLQEKSFDQAQETAESFVARQPDNAAAHSMLGIVLLAKKNPQQAEAAFEKARQVAPGDPSACHNLALLAFSRSEDDKARAYFDEILEHHPDHLKTLMNIAALEETQGRIEAMKETLSKAIRAHPDAVEPRLLLARRYLNDGEPAQVTAVLQKVMDNNKTNPAVLSLLGEASIAGGKFQEALPTLESLVRLQPSSAKGHFLLAKAYGGLNNEEMLEQELARTLELAPDYFPALLAKARLLLHKGDIQAAQQILLQLKDTAAGHPDVLLLDGIINARVNTPQEALASYKKLFATSPSTQSLLTLTRFQWSTGQHAESIVLLEQWADKHPDDVTVLLALGDGYLAQERKADAIAIYRKVLELSENNVLALNNLAWTVQDTNPAQALTLAEKAYAIAPGSGTAMDTLAAILINQGDIKRAQRMNERSLAQSPENPNYLYRHALILEKTGNHDAAEQQIRSLLNKEVDFSEQADAQAMLRRLQARR